MGRRALQGIAKNVCQMFLGYRVHQDLLELERLGAGTLVLDLLGGGCQHNAVPIKSPTIASVIGGWLQAQLIEVGVPAGEVGVAVLTVRYSCRTEFAYRHKELDCMVTVFTFECESRIEAFGAAYTANDRGQRDIA